MVHDAGLSRRSVLFGAGSIAGATLVGGSVAAAAPTPSDEAPGVPTVSEGGGGATTAEVVEALPATNPAWSYETHAYPHFIARPVAGLNASVNSTVGLNLTAGATTFYAPLSLPQGAIVREVVFECYNASTGTSLNVGFAVVTLSSATVGGTFKFNQAGAGKHTVVLGDLGANAVIDNAAASYSLLAFLQPPADQFGFFGARLAYENGQSFTAVRPSARKLDTREPGPASGRLSGNDSRTVSLRPELPAGAKAALVNLTVTDTLGVGYLSVRPAGSPPTATSNINWFGLGQSLANNATVAVSADNQITITAGGFGAAHVVVDLLGFYA